MADNIFKRVYIWLYIMSRLSKKEIKSGKKIPFAKKLWSWQKGFFSSSYVLYNLSKNDHKEYLSDYQENVKAIRLNDKYVSELDDKIKFSALIKDYLTVPGDLAKITNGTIISLNNGKQLSIGEFIDLIRNEETLILKPIDSASGAGVIKISLNDDRVFLNSDEITFNEFENKLNLLKNYLVSSYLNQAAYSHQIFPDSVNTIRILTMVNPENGIPFIAAAAHRFGTNKSAPVDNCNAGGITSSIDLKTGILGKGILTYFDGNNLKWLDNHPDTGSKISGVQIPGWEEIKRKVLEAASRISYLKYIGWDIVATDDGFVVLEGNNGPDIKLHQVHIPLLRNPSTKEFFKYYGVVN